MRYFGVGIEGWATDANQARKETFTDFSDNIFNESIHRQRNVIGAVLGTLTLRYPITCTRFSPHIVRVSEPGEGFDIVQTDGFSGSETKALGQVGGGLEIRITPHVGWVSDF